MKKRILALVTTMVVLVNSCFVFANEGENNTIPENMGIEELYQRRLELALDYDGNREEIDEIDETLEQYGVEEISEEELREKIINSDMNISKDGPMPAYVPTGSGVIWTSRRYYVTYAGITYEAQEIIGQSSESENALQGLYNKTINKSGNYNAGTTMALKGVFTSIAGFVMDSVVEGVSLGISLFQLMVDEVSNISLSSNIKNYQSTYTINLVSNEKFVFIKRLGESDSSQILCYVGNNVLSANGVTYIADIYTNGVITKPGLKTKYYEGNVTSLNYNSSGLEAAQNYYKYDYYHTSFNEYSYLITRYTFSCLGESISCNVPYVAV